MKHTKHWLALQLFYGDALAKTWRQSANEILKAGWSTRVQNSNRKLDEGPISFCDFFEFVELPSSPECTCLFDLDSGAAEVSCQDPCIYCSSESESCGSFTFSISISDPPVFDSEVESSQTFQYDGSERSDTVSFQEFECNDPGCIECQTLVNGELCNSCEICGDGDNGERYRVDCENLVPGSSFDSCLELPGPGVFEYFGYENDECEISAFPPFESPLNDSCQEAETILVGSSTDGNLLGSIADAELLPFFSDCGYRIFDSSQGVWYTFAGTGLPMLVSTCNERVFSDSSVYVYQGTSCNALQCVEGVYQDTSCSGRFTGGASVYFPSILNETYYLYVADSFGPSGSFELWTQEYEDGQNSECSRANDIELANPVLGSIDFLPSGGSLDACDFTFNNDGEAWYRFMAPLDGRVRASTCGLRTGGFFSGITITGDSCTNPICIAERFPEPFESPDCGAGAKIEFNVLAGSIYYITVWGDLRGDVGVFELSLRLVEPPTNDQCENAQVVSIQVGTIQGSITDATKSPDETDDLCQDFFFTDGGVWYSFDGTGESISLTSCSDDFEHIISLYTGSCKNGLECKGQGRLAFDKCEGYASVGTFASVLTEPGETYYILISPLDSGSPAEGDFDLSLFIFEPATNSDCNNATQVFPDGTVILGSTNVALSGDAGGCFFDNFSPGLWYVVIGTGDSIRAETCAPETNFDTEITVYRGVCGNFECIGNDDDGCGSLSSSFTWQSEPFVNYYIRVHGHVDSAVGDFGLIISTIETAPNNQCGGATELVLGDTVEGNFDSATSGDRDFCNDVNFDAPDLWYSFNGTGENVQLSTCSPETSVFGNLQVLTGECGNLTCVASGLEDASCNFAGNTVKLFAEEDVVYTVRFSTFGATSFSNFELSLSEFEIAENDKCETAVEVESLAGTSISGSTSDALPKNSACQPSTDSTPGVWYTFIGNGASIAISTCSPTLNFPTAISLFSGGCDGLECVAFASENFNCEQAFFIATRVTFLSELGVQYSVLVQGSDRSRVGDFDLIFSEVDVPSNDQCSDAIPISLDSGLIFGTTIDAMATVPENLVCGGGTNSPDVWYQINGTGRELTASLCDGETTYDTYLSVYEKRDGACDDIVCVASNDDFCGVASQVSWGAVEGVIYVIRVHGYFENRGSFSLQVSEGEPVLNDECIDAIELDPTVGFQALFGDTDGASNSIQDTCGGTAFSASPDVWYSIEGTNTTITASTCSPRTEFDTQLVVYGGSCDSLRCVAGNDDVSDCQFGSASEITFFAAPGEQYFLRVNGFGITGVGSFELKVTIEGGVGGNRPDNDDCEDAIDLFVGASVIGDTSTGATWSGQNACDGASPSSSPDQWYRVRGTDEVLVASTATRGFSEFDTQLHVYTSASGSCGSLVCVIGDDDTPESVQSEVEWFAVAGQTYFVRVNGFGSSAGVYGLSLSSGSGGAQGPVSDTCEDALEVFLFSDVIGNTAAANPDPVVAGCGDATSVVSNGLWYKIVGVGTPYVASTCNSVTSFDTQISVFTGECGLGAENAFLECVAGNDQFCGDQSSVTFDTVPGATYYLLVHGFLSSSGVFSLNVVPLNFFDDDAHDHDFFDDDVFDDDFFDDDLEGEDGIVVGEEGDFHDDEEDFFEEEEVDIQPQTTVWEDLETLAANFFP